MVSERGRVGPVARALGFAGLLPQVAAVAALLAAAVQPGVFSGAAGPAAAVALIYPLVIFSFLGGMWWGLAMRADAKQPAIVAVAVMPSLTALALFAILVVVSDPRWAFVALGSAILLTLLVDRRLVRGGVAPDGWMRLRVPLSVGLGGLTILAGLLIAALPGALP